MRQRFAGVSAWRSNPLAACADSGSASRLTSAAAGRRPVAIPDCTEQMGDDNDQHIAPACLPWRQTGHPVALAGLQVGAAVGNWLMYSRLHTTSRLKPVPAYTGDQANWWR